MTHLRTNLLRYRMINFYNLSVFLPYLQTQSKQYRLDPDNNFHFLLTKKHVHGCFWLCLGFTSAPLPLHILRWEKSVLVLSEPCHESWLCPCSALKQLSVIKLMLFLVGSEGVFQYTQKNSLSEECSCVSSNPAQCWHLTVLLTRKKTFWKERLPCR